jgi:CBS-domain-containing membrane protein
MGKRHHILDEKLRRERVKNYLIQSAVAGLVFYAMLRFLHEIGGYAFLAGAASSLFTVFAMPKSITAQPRNLIGGHYLCFIVGAAFSFLYSATSICPAWMTEHSFHFIVIALAITLSTLVMVLTDTEHPPAAGTAMAAVVTGLGSLASLALAVFFFPLILALAKYLFRKQLKDLT